MVVGLAEVADDAVAARRRTGRLVGRALADDAEAVRVVDVEQRVVLACDAGEGVEVGRVPGHAVDPVHADQPGRGAVLPEQPLQIVGVAEAEPLERRAVCGGELAAVVDRLVRAAVDEDRALAGEHRDHRRVDERDRRQDERVLAAEQLGQLLLDLPVEHGAAEQPRPARVSSPARRGTRGSTSMISRSRSKPR